MAEKEDDGVKRLNVDAKVENLDHVLSFIDEILEVNDCNVKTKMQIDVAVEELFVNIASYAYSPSTGTALQHCGSRRAFPCLQNDYITLDSHGQTGSGKNRGTMAHNGAGNSARNWTAGTMKAAPLNVLKIRL